MPSMILFVCEKFYCRKYSIYFIFAFQEHQKFVFKASRKTKIAILSFGAALTLTVSFRSFHFNRHASGLG